MNEQMKKIIKFIGIMTLGFVSYSLVIGIIIAMCQSDKTEAINTKDIKAIEKKVEVPKKVEIPKKKEAPRKTVVLNSGQFIVGKDCPAGRYRVTNIGSGSNFIVYGPDKLSKVNTILGNSSVGNGDYTFWAEDGDLINTAAKVKLIPVK